jgi:hypothetical protein
MGIVGAANIVAVVAGLVFVACLIRFAVRGDPQRQAEDDARAYYDLHGRWPDDG